MNSTFKLRLLLLIFAIYFAPVHPTWSAGVTKTIVLIGGEHNYPRGAHEHPKGIKLFKQFLEESSDVTDINPLKIEAHPNGWPPEEAFEGASTVVFYFDGRLRHPLLDEQRSAQIDKLMRNGVGLIALHMSFTLPADNTSVDLPEWLGGARYGHDHSTQPASLSLDHPEHPISNGVGDFDLLDQYYTTIRFQEAGGRVTPILSGNVRTDAAEPQRRTFAWAFARKGGGRSFAFCGGHFLRSWDNPEVRKMFLNAIFWTAGLDVPDNGVRTATDEHAATTLVSPAKLTESALSLSTNNKVERYPWGQIRWQISGELRNSDTLTTGLATILPGKSKRRHYHPNSDEVLYVFSGKILHTVGDKTIEMKAGDSVSTLRGVYHSESNVGSENAILHVSYPTAWREEEVFDD